MKITSILLFITGVIFIVLCVTYFKQSLNVADSDAMTINPSGTMVSEWPVFIGIILVFVGSVFFYVSITEKKLK